MSKPMSGGMARAAPVLSPVIRRRWRVVWLLAALHNFAGVALFTFGRSWIYERDGLVPPSPSLHLDTWVAFVGAFGLLYLLVAYDPESRWAPGLALAGIFAKLASVGPQIAAFATDSANTPSAFALPIFTDLTWVAVFAYFLLARYR